MFNSKSFLCLDFGAGSVKAAEFQIDHSGGLLGPDARALEHEHARVAAGQLVGRGQAGDPGSHHDGVVFSSHDAGS